MIRPDILPRNRWMERLAELLAQGGQRIAIARAPALVPRQIIADEAASALDVSIQASTVALLHHLRQRLGMSFIFIAHDLQVVHDFADQVLAMKKGRVVELGPVEEIFEAPSRPSTKRLLATGLDLDPVVRTGRRKARAALV